MMNLLKLSSFLFLLFPFLGLTQSIEEVNSLKEKYKGYTIVHKLHKINVKIDMEDGVPVVRTSYKDDFVLLNKSVIPSMSQDEISFSSFDTIESINAYSYVYNGKKYKKVKANNFSTKSMNNQGDYFHDDKTVTSFMFPSLTENSFRVLEYSDKTSENRFPFGIFFSSYIPVVKSELIIDCDSSIHILHKLFNLKEGDVDYSEKLDKKRRILSWSLNDPEIIKVADRSPSSRYYMPHILAQISHYFKDGEKVNVLSSAKDLHAWYKNHIKEVLVEEPSESIKSISDSITKGISSEVEKVKSVYYWVQENIKYIAFEEGENGFVPRKASSICFKRYGDCKDMATLIYAMLKYLNVPVYLTWVGTNSLPYKYSEFPSSACDNHMIATYFDNGVPVFLDATNSFLSYGYPSYPIQGKEAFVHLSNEEFKILEIPEMEKEKTSYKDTSYIKIEGSKILGTSRSTTSGYYNFYINEVYENKDEEKLNELIESVHFKGNNTFKVNRSQVNNVGVRDTCLNTEFDFEVQNYVTSYEDEIYINLILDKDISHGEFKKDRIAPFELASHSADQYTVILDIPEGYFIKKIPSDSNFSSDFVDFSLNYKEIEGKLLCDVKLNLKFIYLYKDSFEVWNEFVKVQKKAFVETVVLQKKK